MYNEAGEASLLEMPPGLSHQEKIDFLNREYRKWRLRVTHKDPEVAADASLRLERITKMRRELTDAK